MILRVRAGMIAFAAVLDIALGTTRTAYGSTKAPAATRAPWQSSRLYLLRQPDRITSRQREAETIVLVTQPAGRRSLCESEIGTEPVPHQCGTCGTKLPVL